MALALLRLLRRATPLERWQAFALTLLFVLSPYVLGTSFTLLTDNLAILFALLALERIHAYSRGAGLGRVRARLRRDSGGAPHAPGVRVARAGRRRLPAAPGPALAVPARGRRGHARALDGPVRAARARVGRSRAAERRPGLLRPLRRPSGPRPRGAHAAHRRLHGRARRSLRRARLRAQPGAPAAAAALVAARARLRGTHRPCSRAAHRLLVAASPSACSCS